ncbi:MAG: hypothetical protein AB7O97_02230 [Planctomycetota bacterium]
MSASDPPTPPAPRGTLPPLSRCRARARLLLSHLRGADPARARAAAERLRRLRSFAALSADDLLHDRERVRLKHALTLIAVELGHRSWPALTAECAQHTSAAPDLCPEAMYAQRMGLWLNRWFATYAEARASLDAEGGYLLPYRHQFFVTTAEAVRELGLDPDDADWRAIGFDWVRPTDPAAHARLLARRRAALA